MKPKFIDPTVRRLKPSARVHVSGKLGFNSDAALFMNLKDTPSYVVATSDSEQGKFRILLIDSKISDIVDTPPPITVAKAGKYYYVHFINILHQLNIDFIGNKITFDIERTNYEGYDTYILTKREQQ
ncbi:MAG: hypothetical protein OXH03_06910 [Bacteroidetes bacterium]|nr:hypothetical protein [Bacteroidota bacterium]MDE2671590.1 hypothetical protein [Bacteroidota bacterium]